MLVSQPFLLGISQSFHADSTSMVFMNATALLLLLYLKNVKNTGLLVLTGIFAGLAVLSKSMAVFVLLYSGLILVLDFFVSKRTLAFFLKALGVIFTLAVLTFFALFPAMWVDAQETFESVFIDEGLFLAEEGRDNANIWYYYFPEFFAIFTPFLTFGFVLFLVFTGFSILKKRTSLVSNPNLVYAFLYVFFFFLTLSIISQKMERYLLPILPFMALLVGHFIKQVHELYLSKVSEKIVIPVVFLSAMVYVFYYFPYPLLYASEKGKDQFGCSFCPVAGDYLNAKPNAADLKIIILSKKVHRIKPFVKGKVYSSDELLPNNWREDYLLLSSTEQVPDSYNHCKFEHSVDFRGATFWNIYNCKN
jgi:4-amino-4-deoxy-L-arabinose transferase-like glycosyltransferase